MDNTFTEKEQAEISNLLGQQIKRNKNLQHFDLTSTGLSALIIKDMGSYLRRATACLVVHLSDNPGLTNENIEYLPARIHTRPLEDMERFTRIHRLVVQLYEKLPPQQKEGIIRKMTNLAHFQKKTIDPAQKSIFQRIIGFKQQMPGTGQWY